MLTSSMTLYPSSPLAFLPQGEANQLVIDLYVTVFSLGVIWDVLCHDHLVFRGFKPRFPAVVYVLSSSSNFLHVFRLSSLLFLSRIHGIFAGQIRILLPFVILWLLVAASSCLIIPGMGASNISSSPFCRIGRVEKYVGAPFVCLAVYDTVVLVAVSFQLYRASYADLHKQNWWSYLRGQFLPSFSRALLRDGQSYYCIVVLFNAALLALMLAPVSNLFHDMFAAMSVCISNVMACRVFRQTRKAILQTNSTVNTDPRISFQRPTQMWSEGRDIGACTAGLGSSMMMSADTGTDRRANFEEYYETHGGQEDSRLSKFGECTAEPGVVLYASQGTCPAIDFCLVSMVWQPDCLDRLDQSVTSDSGL